jgi:predicted ester cyclase
MSTETNKAICRRMLEQLWNEHRVDLVQEFFAEDVVQPVVGGPEMPPGPEELKEVLTMTLAAFPDIQLTVDDEIAEGDKVVFRWTMSRYITHVGLRF